MLQFQLLLMVRIIPMSKTGSNIAKSPLPFWAAFTALFVGALAMGISPVFVRNAEVGAFASAFWRVALALPLLGLWSWWEAKNSKTIQTPLFPTSKSVVLVGIFFAGDLFFWHLAILNTTVANATLLACLAPVWVSLFSASFIGEKVARNTYFGLVICLIGAAFLIGSSYQASPERLLGDIYGVITSIFFGLYFLAVRVARRNHGAGALTFSGTAITALILLAVTLIAGQSLIPASPKGASALLALGWLSHSGGQGLLAVALGALSASFSSLVIFIEAIAAAIFGWLLLSEPLGRDQFLGGGLILLGIWIARPKSEK